MRHDMDRGKKMTLTDKEFKIMLDRYVINYNKLGLINFLSRLGLVSVSERPHYYANPKSRR